ncbi:MAG: hypothetical protein MJ252_25660 [archaeon]|nr:hypothetical protein [archaeon]
MESFNSQDSFKYSKSRFYNYSNIEVEIREQDFELFFDAIDKNTGKRYLCKITIPPGFELSDLIACFDMNLYKIVNQTDDKLQLEMTYANESKKVTSTYILNKFDTPTPGQLFEKDPEAYRESKRSLNESKRSLKNEPLNESKRSLKDPFLNESKRSMKNEPLNQSKRSVKYPSINPSINQSKRSVRKDSPIGLSKRSLRSSTPNKEEIDSREQHSGKIGHEIIPGEVNLGSSKIKGRKEDSIPSKKLNQIRISQSRKDDPTPYDKEDSEQALFNIELLQNPNISVWERILITSSELYQSIKLDQKYHPDAYIQNEEMETDIRLNGQSSQYLPIAVLKGILEEYGVNVVVERKCVQPELARDLLQMVVSGLGFLPVYEFHTDYGDSENLSILRNPQRKINFLNDWKQRLSNLLKIPKEDIIVTNPSAGSLKFNVFLGKRLDDCEIKLVKEKYGNEFVQEGIKFGSILLKNCKLSLEMFDPEHNNYDHWAPKNKERRGGEVYDSPEGWRGFALKVWSKYDNGDNTWIGMKNRPGEFCVAYHGVGQNAKDPLNLVGLIVTESLFKAGNRQAYANSDNIRKRGEKCGTGAYYTPSIEEAEKYAGKTIVNGKNYKAVFMCRVNPQKIREPRKNGARFWILSGKTDEVRPYRILLLEC